MTVDEYAKTISENIIEHRKRLGLTQSELASMLGVSFQAVSKYENGISCPDIFLLPLIAEIFDISIDELFGIKKESDHIAFEEPGKLYIVVYKDGKILQKQNVQDLKISIDYSGEVNDIDCAVSINCDNITGNARAGASINCDDIYGDAFAGCDVNCDKIFGSATAGSDINCDEIMGNAQGNK